MSNSARRKIVEQYAEIESLRQQLAAANQEIERKMSAGQFVLEQLAAALAACEAKDKFLHFAWLDVPMNDYAFSYLKETLAVKPDASILKQHDEALIERCAEVADTVRQRYSHEYDQRQDDWQGDVYWARLVGSVTTVTAIRELKLQL